MNNIPSDILQFLRSALQKRNFFSYRIQFHEHNIEGEGFTMSDIFYLSVRDVKDVVKTMELVLKIATRNQDIRQYYPVNDLYRNECLFYETVWPLFLKYQIKVLGSKMFNMVPSCFATKTEPDYEKLLIENLKAKQYEILNKKDCFTQYQIECVFREYGKFHAVSMAMKETYPQLFIKSQHRFFNYFDDISKIKHLKISVEHLMNICMKYLMEEEEFDIMNDLQKYIKHVFPVFRNSGFYKGNNIVLIHGDSQSDNIMLKYRENGEIEDIKFIDFQFARFGTPVYDLSYCLYSAGTEELFNQLDHLLEVYHQSLSETLSMFKCNSKALYSFSTLKLEWRQYSRYGFIMGLLVMTSKLTEDNKELNLSELILRYEDACRNIDKQEAKRRLVALLRHMSLYRLL